MGFGGYFFLDSVISAICYLYVCVSEYFSDTDREKPKYASTVFLHSHSPQPPHTKMSPPAPLLCTSSLAHLLVFSPSPTGDDPVQYGTHGHPNRNHLKEAYREENRRPGNTHTFTSGNPRKNLRTVPRLNTTRYPSPFMYTRKNYPHFQYHSNTHKKRNTDDEISSSTHRYTNCIAPS